MTEEAFDKVIAVNLKGTFNVNQVIFLIYQILQLGTAARSPPPALPAQFDLKGLLTRKFRHTKTLTIV
jgi:hypothetical protein